MSAVYLLALRPPPELTGRVQTFREQHGLRDAAAEPHITVKPRSGLTPDLAWAGAARQAVLEHAPVKVSVGGPRLFRNGSALYLHVSSREAVHLHLALLNAIRPARRFGYEGPHLTPHLSVALSRPGLDLAGLLIKAEQAFGQLDRAPLIFTAHSVTLMRKPGPGGFYTAIEEWPLGQPEG